LTSGHALLHEKRAVIQSFTFVFHAFISANMIASSNHLCRKSYRLADAHLENISWRMFIVNDARCNCYVRVAVFDGAGCYCIRHAQKTKKQGIYRKKTLMRDADARSPISVFPAALIVRMQHIVGPVVLFLCRHRH
jgi:hypothetical protein